MKTQCPHCKVKFNTNDANAGRQAKCPKCAQPFTIQPVAEVPAQAAPTLGAKPAPPPAAAPPKTPQPAQTPPPAVPPKNVQPPQEAPSAPPAPKPAQPPPAPQKPVEAAAASAVAPRPATVAPNPPQAQATMQKPRQAAAQQAPLAKAAEPIKEEAAPKTLPKKTMPKLLYVYGWLAACVITGILAVAGMMLALGQAGNSTVLAAFAAGDVFLLAAVAIELLLFYRMWDAIPAAQASISPGKAVGFLFIPGFNIYWALLMLTAFTEDCSARLRRSTAQVKELPAMLYAAHAFTLLLFAIFLVIPLLCTLVISHFVNRVFSYLGDLAWPVVGLAVAIGLAHLVTYVLTANKTCTAVNALQGE